MKEIKIFTVILGSIFLAGCSLSGSGSSSVISNSNSGSIWKSADGGKTWNVQNKVDEKTILSQLDVLTIAFNQNDAKNVFVGTKDGVLLQTTDGGATWQKVNFSSPKIYGLGLNPNDGKNIYASGVLNGRGKIFESLDAGQNWKEIFTMPADGPLVISLIIDKNNPQTIYVSTSDNQILRSLDGGNSWQNIYTSQSPVTKVVLDRKNSGLIYAITLSGTTFRSRDGGKTFEDISGKISVVANNNFNSNIVTLETDPNNGNWVYAGGGAGLLLSKDGGDSWQLISSTVNNSKTYPIKTIAVNPVNSSEIIYGAGSAVYESIDGGSSWTTSQFTGDQSVKVLKYNLINPSEMFLGLSK